MGLHVRLYSLLLTEIIYLNNLKSVIVYLFLFSIKEMFVNQFTIFIYEAVLHCNQKVR